MPTAWPVVLEIGNVRLRPIQRRDAKRWMQLRELNKAWLTEWEATAPFPDRYPAPTFRQSVKRLIADAHAGRALPFIVEYNGTFVGQLNVSDISYGSHRGCHFGYWIDQTASDRGIMTAACALVTDYLINELELHRVEVAIRPENEPSNRLIQRLGFRYEGMRPRFLHINGEWRDHNIYVMTAEEINGRLVDRLNRVP